MANIIPFESAKLPSAIAKMFSVSDDLSNGVSSGFPHISIKGKVFHIVRGGERTMISKPDDEDSPASNIEVVILKANPNISKVYYEGGYVEGSDAKPACYSNDGISPAADAESAQAKKCALCTHNQWGSRISESGSNGKACSDTRRIAIAPLNQLNDPMLLRVPATSLKPLAEFNNTLKKRNVPYQGVVTKIGFDYTVSHPALTFKPVGFVDDELASEIMDVVSSDVIKNIIGANEWSMEPAGTVSQPEEEFEQPAPKAKAKPAVVEEDDEKPYVPPKAKAKPAVVEEVEPEPEVKPVKKAVAVEPIDVESEPVTKPAKKAAPIEVSSLEGMLSELDSMLEEE